MKGFLQSKTILGVLVALAGSFLGRYGVDICGADAQAAATDVLTLAGGVLAVYGRIRADAPLAGLWRRAPRT